MSARRWLGWARPIGPQGTDEAQIDTMSFRFYEATVENTCSTAGYMVMLLLGLMYKLVDNPYKMPQEYFFTHGDKSVSFMAILYGNEFIQDIVIRVIVRRHSSGPAGHLAMSKRVRYLYPSPPLNHSLQIDVI